MENVTQTGDGNDFSGFTATDFVVLAEYTPQIAAGEKDGAAATGAGNTRFFSKVRSSTRNHRKGRGAAIA